MIKRGALAVLLVLSLGFVSSGRAASTGPVVEKGQSVTLRFSKHAKQRMLERNVSSEVVVGIVNTVSPFKYYHQGRWKTGYYDPDKRIFIAADGDLVITVIDSATPHYVAGLKSKKP